MSTLSDWYANTLGPLGQTFNDKITAPIVDDAHAILGAPAYFIHGTQQNLTDLAGGVKTAYGGAGQLVHDVGQTTRDFGTNVVDLTKHTVDKTTDAVKTPLALGGLGLVAVAGIVLLLIYNESKDPKVTKSAAEGAARGLKE